MKLRLIAPIALLLTFGGCSSDRSDGRLTTPDNAFESPSQVEDPAVQNAEFVSRWTLRNYTLDDGISKTVPGDVEVGIEIRSDGTLQVDHDVCEASGLRIASTTAF